MKNVLVTTDFDIMMDKHRDKQLSRALEKIVTEDVRCPCLTLLLISFAIPLCNSVSETLAVRYILLFPTFSLPTVYSNSWDEIHVIH